MSAALGAVIAVQIVMGGGRRGPLSGRPRPAARPNPGRDMFWGAVLFAMVWALATLVPLLIVMAMVGG